MSATHTAADDCALSTPCESRDPLSGSSAIDSGAAAEFPRFPVPGLGKSFFYRATQFPQQAALGAAGMVARLGNVGTGRIGILLYHRVMPSMPGLAPSMNVSPDVFRAQLSGLLRRNFRPMSLKAALDAHRTGGRVPRESFVVTFDDAYESVYQFAYPILAELKIPATVFMATSYLDSQSPFPFDDWCDKGSSSVLPSTWRPLSTAQCREMIESGWIDLGSHTHTHADFRNRPGALQADVATSLEVLREKFAVHNAPFAFPYGKRGLGFSGPELSAAVQKAGATCALTTETDLVSLPSDPFDWGRLDVTQNDSATTIAGRLSGWYNLARDFGRAAKHLLKPGRQAR